MASAIERCLRRKESDDCLGDRGAGRYGEATVALAARTADATKIYGKDQTEVRALDRVTVGFARGAMTAIMGPSGSGKSTLLHCIAGLDTLSGG